MDPAPDKLSKDEAQSRRSRFISIAALASLATSCLTLLYIAGPAAFQYSRNAIYPPLALPTPPVLPDYYSERMGGGSDPYHACYPRLLEYQKQYPNYQIRMQSTSENTTKDIFGRTTSYVYRCSFVALPPGKN